MALSTRNRRGIGLIAFVAFALAMVFLEQRVLVPFAMSRPAADEVVYWEQHVERNEETAASRLRLGIAYAEVGELAAAENAFTNCAGARIGLRCSRNRALRCRCAKGRRRTSA